MRTVRLVPAALEAILVLPQLVRQLDEVRAQTAALPEILVELQRVHGDTRTLPLIREELERMRSKIADVEQNTLSVQQLVEIAVPLQGAALRVGRLADRLPQRRGRQAPE